MSATARWEYTTAERAEQLNALGSEGWELVGVTVVEGIERFYLKRPLPSLREQITLDQRKQVLAGPGGGTEG
ncbi:hypothetical protein FE784_28150 [Paenibacillus hemerocallicola]|uniref:DUF4177 domain-containing protein n=1 Tax=Paenibacillus hemerocallicola TaxID=1172614 RepID=A0A5C4T1C2_9BACL|nr:hypothetical protein [Paenibacillus hemerocallicola]TNJ62902.1 hypothetical protein FE784_28150 [Paenibacillus hemerocallicola]